MSGIKVLALDLDGTLTNKAKQITPGTQKAVDEAIAAGVKIVLASGRPVGGIMPVAKELGLDQKGGYILAFNGGQIVDIKTGETLYQQELPAQYIPDICKFAEEMGLPALSYNKEGVVTNVPDDRYIKEEAWINRMPILQVDDLVAYINYPITKMLIVGDPEICAEAEKKINARFEGKFNAFRSMAYFLECVPVGVDKAKSLEVLLGILGCTREELMACGDGFNDVSMIEYAGMGVAMANAEAEVKAKANAVTLSNEEDGVAAAIYKYILQ